MRHLLLALPEVANLHQVRAADDHLEHSGCDPGGGVHYWGEDERHLRRGLDVRHRHQAADRRPLQVCVHQESH